MFSVFGSNMAQFSGAGALGVLVLATVASHGWGDIEKVSEQYTSCTLSFWSVILILLSHSIVFNSVLSSSQILILFNTVWCFLMLKVQIVSVLSAKFCGLNQIASVNGY